ncbi:MAG: GTPase HflX [Anaerolineales bacterium]|jgi:GTP-binding protein HflX
MPKFPALTHPPQERAYLFGIERKGESPLLSLRDSLAELARLSETAGLRVVGQDYQRIQKADANTLIGSGKVEQLRQRVNDTGAEVVIFDEELAPRHLREIERALGEEVRVLDRTALILDIFAQHAHSREGALQVQLAQYEYRLPRLTRAWTHLARQSGGAAGRGGTGGVGLRGPGETQLEIDRREVARHIAHLQRELEKVRAHRSRYRLQRKRSGIPVVALVGYTNAGKSTLLNAIAHTELYTADQLFATLDPTTRRIRLPQRHEVLLTDTVGFIQKLPSTLVAAFHATLEEIGEADLLVHVVDITHPNAAEQAQAVHQTLKELEIVDLPIVTALNKSDQLQLSEETRAQLLTNPSAILISALHGEGVPALLARIESALFETLTPVRVRLPATAGNLIQMFYRLGCVESVTPGASGVIICGRLPGYLMETFREFIAPPLSKDHR